MAILSRSMVSKLYQWYQICTTFLYLALLARWIILLPLVGSKFLPGGIHEFLCHLMVWSSMAELVWLLKFHGFKKGFQSRTLVKCLNFFYFVTVLHFHDDYEHALVLKNTSYSSFIIGLSLTQAYSHWCKLFKRGFVSKRSLFYRLETWIWMPLLYISEFYLLLLNVQNPNFHSTPVLDRINKVILVLFFPIALTLYKRQL
ncbi:hypothetical protein ZYGR_0AN01090 [Zygosaccharomyces rouxii]|uniref:Very-long-chain (3R)-3-hydroxyacyl-CoA dehydratase n=1 Tax=Zygosaccharomyces rouxii TaxID=4956 RepID=A0A1Q3AG43_ZYGRO|nr:hypothetical protein ZYGR_0AN01090 [Zygosaccharomyces rouxii]